MLNRAHSKFMHNPIIHKHNYICSTSSSIHAYFMLCLLKRNQLLKQYKYSGYYVYVPAFSATRVYRWCKMREGQAFGSNLKYKHFLYMLMNRVSTPLFWWFSRPSPTECTKAGEPVLWATDLEGSISMCFSTLDLCLYTLTLAIS